MNLRRVWPALLGLAAAAPAQASDLWELRGFIEPEARAYLGTTHPRFTDSSKPDGGLDLRLYPTDQVDGAIVGDFDLRWADVPSPEIRFDLRETWARFYTGPFTLTLGKQLHTWGMVDEFGVADILNPQELPDLAQGANDRKLGIWTLKAAWDFGPVVAEAYVMPFFTPSDLPMGGVFASSTLPRPLQRAIAEDAARGQAEAAAAEAELAAGEAAIAQGRIEIESGYAALASAETQIENGIAQIENGIATIDGNLAGLRMMPPSSTIDAQIAALEAERSKLYSQISGLNADLAGVRAETAGLRGQEQQLEAQAARLAAGRQQFETERAAGERAFREGLSPQRVEPPAEPIETDVAVRLFAPLSFGDLAVGFARLHDQIGTLRYVPMAANGGVPAVLWEHPRLSAWTFEASIPVSVLSLRAEALYIHTADPDGSDPFLRNPTLQTAAQAFVRFSPEWQVRLGIADEQVFKIDDPRERADERSLPSPIGSPLLLLDDHIAHAAVTYRIRGRMDQVTVAYLNAYENDGHFAAADVDYGIVEGIRLKVGGQFFAGPRDRSFGSLNPLDNVYLAMRMVF